MGVLQWWANDPRVQIPEQTPNSLIGSQQRPAILGFADQRGPLSQLAYQMAGSPQRGPLANSGFTTPPSGVDFSGAGAGGQNPLSSLNSVNSTYNKGNNLYQNLTGADFSAVGSGAAANGALSSAGFGAGAATPALDLGATGVGGLAAVGGTGTGALGATTFAGASPEAAAAIDAAAGGAAGTGALAAGGLSTALPIAAIGWAVADALNKSGDIKSGGTSALVKGLVDQSGWKLVNPKNQTYVMPDGRWIQVGTEARAVSEALRKGDPNAQQLFDAWLATARKPGG